MFSKVYALLDVDFEGAIAMVDSFANETGSMTPEEQLDFHNQAARFFSTIGNFEKEALHWNEQIKLLPLESDTLYTTKLKLGMALMNTGKFEESLGTFRSCASYFSRHVNPSRLARSYNGMGVVLGHQSKSQEAIVYFTTAIKMFEYLDIPVELSRTYSNLSILYIEMDEFQKALEMREIAYHIVLEENLEKEIHFGELNIGASYNSIGEFNMAIVYLLKSKEYYESNFNAQILNAIYNELGRSYSELGENSLAEFYYLKSIDLLKTGGFDFALPGTMCNYGNVLNSAGQSQKAIQVCNSAFSLAQEMGYLEVQMCLCECLYTGYKNLNRADSALFFYENLQLIIDSVSNVDVQKSVLKQELETSHGIERQNILVKATDEINKEVYLRRLWIAGAMVLFAVTVFIFFAFRQKKKSEQAINKEKQYLDNLLHNLVHEFRTPLTLIKGPTEELLKKDANNKLLQMVDKNSDQMLMLVNQVLDFAKIKAGRLTVVNEVAHLSLFFQDIIALFSPLAAEKKIELVNQVDPIDSLVQIDTDKLFKIVSNLISNAIKYSDANARVTVQASLSTKMLSLTIQDTGVGISVEDQQHVFKKFYQVDATITRKAEGTGLGLAFVHELVTLMQGQIKLESKLNSGTKITVDLPVVIMDSVPTTDQSTAIGESSSSLLTTDRKEGSTTDEEKKLILIIEDNTDLQSFLSQLLMAEGYEVQVAKDGMEGIEKAVELLPDLVVSDVMMPKMDGLQVVQKLKSTFATDHIPIIILTAKVSFDSMLDGLSVGADDYLSKPFKSQELMLRVSNQLKRQEKLQAKYKKDQLDPIIEAVKDPLIQKIEDVIFEDASVQISVEDLAQQCALSRSQLHRKIKFITGMSTTALLTEMRLTKSKVDLKLTVLSISEIAYKYGYSDPAHYSKLFKKQFNETPSDYRNVLK